NNASFHKDYAIVNLNDLNDFKAGTVVNEQLLRESKLVRGDFVGIKILGDGELKHALKIEADKISESAKAKIEKAGGSVTMRDRAAEKPAAPADDVDQTATEGKSQKRSTSKSKPKAKKKSSRK
ncbi:MAG TPA: uL15m family ribosomal protein, partial [Chthoniobacterales bacterium]